MRRVKPLQPGHAAAWLSALTLACCLGCSAPQVLPPEIATGDRVGIAGTSATIAVPRGFSRIDAQSWGLEVEHGRVVLLRVQRAEEPPAGAEAHVDDLVAEINRLGQEGIERDEHVALGDLQGRMIQAVQLRGEEPASLWLMVLVAEDGMYTASAVGPASDIRRLRPELETFLKSLRVPLPAPSLQRAPAPAVDPLEIEPPTADSVR